MVTQFFFFFALHLLWAPLVKSALGERATTGVGALGTDVRAGAREQGWEEEGDVDNLRTGPHPAPI